MLIENSFDVHASPHAAWSLLVDVPRVVPCMPGASLERTIDDSTWEVLQRVKLGPISLQFRSDVRRTELNDEARRAVLVIKAREVRGRGGAEATITSDLVPTATGTRVGIATELTLQGTVAQYGRPVVGSVAEELTRQFAACLASQLEAEEPAAAEPSAAPKPVGGLRLFFASLWAEALRPELARGLEDLERRERQYLGDRRRRVLAVRGRELRCPLVRVELPAAMAADADQRRRAPLRDVPEVGGEREARRVGDEVPPERTERACDGRRYLLVWANGLVEAADLPGRVR